MSAVPTAEDFAAAWASKCEELARETAKVTALHAALREVLESRAAVPFDRKRYGEALRVGWAMVGIADARAARNASTVRDDADG